MPHPISKRFAKPLLLLVGLVLSGVVGLEMRQDIVKALELNDVPIPTPTNAVPAVPDAIERPAVEVKPEAAEPQANRSPAPSPQPTQANQPATRQPIAINTGTAEPQQISEVSPTQIAVGNDWRGASFPVEDFQEYTSPFGYRLSATGGYSEEFHYGLDMAAPEGSYIRNWWGGKVVEVSDDSNCGTSVVVESGPWLHIYCHMQGHVESADGERYMIDREGGVQILEGQALPAGVRIGRVGMTGRTTGPHLHWGLRYQGNWVDPALVLRAMYSSQQAMQAN